MSDANTWRLAVEHISRYHYEASIQGSVMSLRLYPRKDQGQRVLSFRLEIEPETVPIEFQDSYGNTCHMISIHKQISESILIKSKMEVATARAPDLTDDVDSNLWEILADIANPVLYWDYLNPSRFTRNCPALDVFISAHGIRKSASPLSSLLHTSSLLYSNFRYEPGITAVDSSIEKILETGRGVCQDYTHVLLAIARSWGIPSRYVSGYLQLDGEVGEDRVPPTGASHAWGEFLLPYCGWVGIDPTNDTIVDQRYIRIAVGRDYADVPPTKGVVFGGSNSLLDVRVTVNHTDGIIPSKESSEERLKFDQ